jgi:hypothetical protein
MGSLTGGPKDEDPPLVVDSSPENYSIQFNGKRIEVTFDEFITLNNINQELIVSPPLKEKPEVRLKGKTLLVELNNELKDSTTYTLNFGEAIKDNNEGNPLSNYEFVFSTGEFLDSLSVGGTLVNAFDLAKIKDPTSVMLYTDLDDSIVHKDIPVYIGKTDKEGNFRINNLRAGTYKIFALQDVNNNFLFDLPNEAIAFADSFLHVDPDFFLKVMKEEEEKMIADSLVADSLLAIQLESDSLLADSTAISMVQIMEQDSAISKSDSIIASKLPSIPKSLMVDLLLFTEENLSQFLSNNDRKTRKKIEFSFNLPVSDSFYVKNIIPDRTDWFLLEESADRDSFIYWILDKEVSDMDTILMELNYVILDSMSKRAWKKDSIYFNYREPAKSARKKDDDKEPTEVLAISGLRNNETIDLNAKLKFTSATPVNYVDTSFIELFKIEDTIKTRSSFNLVRDSIKYRILHFNKEWDSRQKYELNFFPGALMDMYGSTNDTLNFKFTTRSEDYYGVLILNMDSLQSPMLIQLLDTKEKVLREIFMDEPGSHRFEYLKASSYRLKFIYDENRNKKWDTGKYILKRQPEKVEYYKGSIDIRANWDMEVKFR